MYNHIASLVYIASKFAGKLKKSNYCLYNSYYKISSLTVDLSRDDNNDCLLVFFLILLLSYHILTQPHNISVQRCFFVLFIYFFFNFSRERTRHNVMAKTVCEYLYGIIFSASK